MDQLFICLRINLENKLHKIIYFSNFLSQYGINPTPAEKIIEILGQKGLVITQSSRFKNRILRFLNNIFIFFTQIRSNEAISVIDVFTGGFYFKYLNVLVWLHNVFKVNYILVLHGGGLPEKLRTHPKNLKKILLGARKIIVPSNYLQHVFRDFNPILIPNGIYFDNYFAVKPGLEKKILFFRAFHKYYDPLTLIKAIYIVFQEIPDVTLDMFGYEEDGTKEKCREFIKIMKLEKIVKLHDRIEKNKIGSLGNRFGIYVNSSIVDNAPVSTIEAMAMGMPIVSTNAGGLPFLLKNNQTAILVEKANPSEMAQAIIALIQNPDLRNRLGHNARKEAMEMNWEEIIKKWIEIFQ